MDVEWPGKFISARRPLQVCTLKQAPKHGGRIKTWAGPTAGYGYVNNITFRYALCTLHLWVLFRINLEASNMIEETSGTPTTNTSDSWIPVTGM